MPIDISLVVSPETAANIDELKRLAAVRVGLPADAIQIRIIRTSVDARQRNIKINVGLSVFNSTEEQIPRANPFQAQLVANARPVIIAGSGPAGLFAALRLIELGVKPILIERGKDVSARKRDIAQISRAQIINPESNYCFGEGGAGTFSDGKLYTRSKKRGSVNRILELFYLFGASEEILYESHPHIGTDKLPGIISAMRNTILECGGEVHFETRLTGFIIENQALKGIKCQNGQQILADAVILATGHSARDVYELLYQSNIAIESKAFAMGVRVEHPQELIDKIQYKKPLRDKWLPAASYSLVEQVNGRGVYSFCMCPGGFIVPSATSPNEMVVNGMSPSLRNSPYANSGIAVELRTSDWPAYASHGPLAGMYFQQHLEQLAHQFGGSGQQAPAQRLTDFVAGKNSQSLPACSYFPGTVASPMHEWLPEPILSGLREGFRRFDYKMKGFLTSQAVILGVESRTSSPVRIPRDENSFQHIQLKGLYPAGEGAGYAGGIVSSAIDGQNCAEAIVRAWTTQSL